MRALPWHAVGLFGLLGPVGAACDRNGPAASPGDNAASAAPGSPEGGEQASGASKACQSDADCALVSASPPRCCSRCGGEAVTRAEAEKARRECSDIAKSRKDCFEECPHLSCPCQRERATCRGGRCEVQRGPC